MIPNLIAALAVSSALQPSTPVGGLLVTDSINASTPGVQVLNTGGALSYRIPLELLMDNDDMAGVAALGIPLSPTDPVIVDTGSGQAGNWDEQLGDVDYVQFFPTNTCVQAGTCRYQLRGLDGMPIPEAGFGDIVFTGTNPSADAVDDYRGFALGAGPFRIDVAANDLGTSNLGNPPTQIEVVAVLEGDGNAEIENVDGVDVLRYRPVTTSLTVGRVRYRLIGCGATQDTAVATFAIGVFALEDDVLSPDTPGVERIGTSYRIPYSLLWQNDAIDFGALSATDPIIVDQGTAQGGAWTLSGPEEFMTFGPSDLCFPGGTCLYGLRDAQGNPITDDTAFITFNGFPVGTTAFPDARDFENGSGPYRIDVLANDTGFDPFGLATFEVVQVATSNGIATRVFDSLLGRDVLEFLPDFPDCGEAVVEYYARGCTDSNLVTATFRIVPPSLDCNANCLVDAAEPDADGDGLPDDCELASGPCDVKRNAPGSVLLFPVFDNRATNVTLATITNTNPSILRAPNGLLAGTVDVEIVYIARFGPDGIDLPCLETNTTRRLTPNDSFTFWTRTDNPNAELGFFYAFAKDPTTGQAISWNHLVGETLLLSGFEDMEESYAALSFRSPLAQGTPTDLDGDGVRDLDGIEYDGAPDQILIPRFFGQDPPGTQGGHADRLVLVALSGGFEFETVVDVTIYNDNEVAFSAEHLFRCWDAPLLTEVSGGFLNQFLLDNENDAPDEGIGPADRQYGWIRLDGDRAFSTQDEVLDPAFYALLFERIGTRVVASPPFESCSQSNGDLFATGIFAER